MFISDFRIFEGQIIDKDNEFTASVGNSLNDLIKLIHMVFIQGDEVQFAPLELIQQGFYTGGFPRAPAAVQQDIVCRIYPFRKNSVFSMMASFCFV